MGYVSFFALAMLTAFLFFIIDSVSKMASDVKIVLSWVKQNQLAQNSIKTNDDIYDKPKEPVKLSEPKASDGAVENL